jgi:hypothetical protein
MVRIINSRYYRGSLHFYYYATAVDSAAEFQVGVAKKPRRFFVRTLWMHIFRRRVSELIGSKFSKVIKLEVD